MKNDWIMFRRESDNEYFVFNGSEVINIMPGPKLNIWDNESPVHKELMAALDSPRKKLIVIDKARHIVVARGSFLKEEQ